MALTTLKFREDFELGSCTGVPPLAAAMLMTHAAFVERERQIAIFDAIANAWLDVNDAAARAASLRQLPWLKDGTVPSSEWTPPRVTDLRAEMHVAPFKRRTPELLNF
jgi:hypothetical protein